MPTSVERRLVQARALMVEIETLADKIAAARTTMHSLEMEQQIARRALLELEVRPEDVWDSFVKESPANPDSR